MSAELSFPFDVLLGMQQFVVCLTGLLSRRSGNIAAAILLQLLFSSANLMDHFLAEVEVA